MAKKSQSYVGCMNTANGGVTQHGTNFFGHLCRFFLLLSRLGQSKGGKTDEPSLFRRGKMLSAGGAPTGTKSNEKHDQKVAIQVIFLWQDGNWSWSFKKGFLKRHTVVSGFSDTLGDRQKCHYNRLSL